MCYLCDIFKWCGNYLLGNCLLVEEASSTFKCCVHAYCHIISRWTTLYHERKPPNYYLSLIELNFNWITVRVCACVRACVHIIWYLRKIIFLPSFIDILKLNHVYINIYVMLLSSLMIGIVGFWRSKIKRKTKRGRRDKLHTDVHRAIDINHWNTCFSLI